MKKISLMLLLIGLVPYNAVAQTCATPPSCASMGYTLSAPKPGRGWLCSACPFDATKFSCTALPCPESSSLSPTLYASTYDEKTRKCTCLGGSFAGYSGDKTCWFSGDAFNYFYDGDNCSDWCSGPKLRF